MVEFFDVLMDVLRCVGVSNVGRICSLEKEWTEDMGPHPVVGVIVRRISESRRKHCLDGQI